MIKRIKAKFGILEIGNQNFEELFKDVILKINKIIIMKIIMIK